MEGSKAGDVTLVKGCMICHKEEILMAKKNSKHPLPPKGSILPQVCDECREKYLKQGVLLVNPDNGRLVVIKDEAFNKMFDQPIPEGKIAYTDDQVLDKIFDSQKNDGGREKKCK